MSTVDSPSNPRPTLSDADRNWRRFVLFRVLFNSRFYYPVLAVLFLDLGLSATEYTLLNFAWALAIVCTDVPAGVLAGSHRAQAARRRRVHFHGAWK